MTRTLLPGIDQPADREFVARVRRELADARARAQEVIGSVRPREPKPGYGTVVPKKRDRRSAGVRERRQRILMALMCGDLIGEIAKAEHVSFVTARKDVEALLVEHGARNVHHLVALAALDLNLRIEETREQLRLTEEFRARLDALG